jgi:hypothetical protein
VRSSLQGNWQNLRNAVVEYAAYPGRECVLLHIDEGMSWESVSNLRYRYMRNACSWCVTC